MSRPADDVKAVVTALLAGDDALASRLAHGPEAGCAALEASRWLVVFLGEMSKLKGEELAAWWGETLVAEAAGEAP